MTFHRFSRSCEALFLMPWPKLRTSHPFKDGCLDQSWQLLPMSIQVRRCQWPSSFFERPRHKSFGFETVDWNSSMGRWREKLETWVPPCGSKCEMMTMMTMVTARLTRKRDARQMKRMDHFSKLPFPPEKMVRRKRQRFKVLAHPGRQSVFYRQQTNYIALFGHFCGQTSDIRHSLCW